VKKCAIISLPPGRAPPPRRASECFVPTSFLFYPARAELSERAEFVAEVVCAIESLE